MTTLQQIKENLNVMHEAVTQMSACIDATDTVLANAGVWNMTNGAVGNVVADHAALYASALQTALQAQTANAELLHSLLPPVTGDYDVKYIISQANNDNHGAHC